MVMSFCERGYNWSSTPHAQNGVGLNFAMTWVAPYSADRRTIGFQLRCLSE
ncbi:hypothetical protein [uncultured Rikenella sp.]|uniref:hypothetical protein n=1 Tax=uncultured Rikenella sp. TaxID=368003 RepID=UPI002614D8C8|nr:hypothetical protein [uncultured Rikenella sp.]